MRNLHKFKVIVLLISVLWPVTGAYAVGIDAFSVSTNAQGGQTYSVTIQILALMTALTVLPALLLTMTSFTRIMIVLSLLRQALGTAQAPSNQILLGLSLFLTIFIMMPVFDKVYVDAVQPYLEEKIDVTTAIERASGPFRLFMLKQTRESDLEMFVRISGHEELQSDEDVPFSLLLPAYVTSELKTAFQIGFLIFLPFLIIDLVVASVLMSMGMMMLSPMIISLPFKLMLFVLADGWSLIMEMLAASFYVT
ncbi:MAG: flagellar type III secretion system pore protein FliP [Methylicorpusculum sp.]|uniref:flagellar type III secretion system pore protein FliP n=1 Tax=Methylicorpusculum sp. TaxID=2713644 RepID=UPI00271ADD97|nr:flagellar type III secretion system pore protein FliP [Methylicorpusculum sp.]MDO8937835.1 flagellar type III secretion system pore protein FliP [Methylicorpusculum sp.]MDP2178108.1 flagellar type III secretion system pore protein FliP [Methylicorpusculum sp.]MDP2202578.1 flagellar type III secretion system pore protein FliP [Methylicorpusculum sp.]MDP3528998.1 flagellar type III secretion system pore protein FliP [Methylicorpusculum sp.]MDZ4151476.1 flagellar type III secretion system pore